MGTSGPGVNPLFRSGCFFGAGICLAAGTVVGWAGQIPVPNASFESPLAPFVNTHVDSWQKTPKPEWYLEEGGYTWDQLGGLFRNPAPGNSEHIGNCLGDQALWIFAVPEFGLFQDYDSTDWANPIPTHAFNAVFEVGKSYRLTVGVIGGGGNMPSGVSLELGLYYRDGLSNQVIVRSTTITNSREWFSSMTNLVDFQVNVPTVKAEDPWAGQHVGIRLFSCATTNLQGGYWDVDNVRLADFEPPRWANPTWTNGQFSVVLLSEPGARFEVVASSNAAAPDSSWVSRGTLTNVTGMDTFVDPTAGAGQRYYRARQLP